jgi:hypothetical protein
MVEIARRQKLRLSHRARPGAAHGRGRNIAALKDLQRRENLPRNRSGRVDMKALVTSTRTAEWGILARPKPDSRPQTATMIEAGTPYLLSIRRNTACVLLHQRAARRGKALQPLFAEIGAGASEFGLALGAFLRLGKPRRRQIRQLPVEFNTVEGAVKHRFGDALVRASGQRSASSQRVTGIRPGFRGSPCRRTVRTRRPTGSDLRSTEVRIMAQS